MQDVYEYMDRSNAAIAEDIRKLDEQIRKEREDAGKSEERPAQFLAGPISCILAENLNIRPYAVRTAKTLMDGESIPVKLDKLRKYYEIAKLLRMSVLDRYAGLGTFIMLVYEDLERYLEEGLDPKAVGRELFGNIAVMDSFIDFAACTQEEEEGIDIKEIQRQAEALKADEAAMNLELEQAWEHYKTIEKDI